jgi:hypothetical protein
MSLFATTGLYKGSIGASMRRLGVCRGSHAFGLAWLQEPGLVGERGRLHPVAQA